MLAFTAWYYDARARLIALHDAAPREFRSALPGNSGRKRQEPGRVFRGIAVEVRIPLRVAQQVVSVIKTELGIREHITYDA